MSIDNHSLDGLTLSAVFPQSEYECLEIGSTVHTKLMVSQASGRSWIKQDTSMNIEEQPLSSLYPS